MTDTPAFQELAVSIRREILQDLEKTEAYHMRREKQYREQRDDRRAEVELGLAQLVRVCIVVAQAAVNRVLLDQAP